MTVVAYLGGFKGSEAFRIRHSNFMATGGIQGQLLDITVVGCLQLRDTEWISRQDPYVCLEYANSKFRTKTCTDGGKNPSFNEKFVLRLIEGLREINISVWNSNTVTTDDLIGSGTVLLEKVISSGYDDSTWSLQTKRGKYGGQVRLILHYANAGKSKVQSQPSAPPHTCYSPAIAPYAPPTGYTPYQQPSSFHPGYPPMSSYQTPPTSAYPPPPSNVYPPPPAYYPPPGPPYLSSPYGTTPSTYPPAGYPPPGPQGTYPAQPYPGYYPGP